MVLECVDPTTSLLDVVAADCTEGDVKPVNTSVSQPGVTRTSQSASSSAWPAQPPSDTIMNDSQDRAFLKDMQTEYHNTDFQRRLQEEDAAAGKDVRKSKKSRWNRECQRGGGTPQMWQLLSFFGEQNG